MQLPEEFGNRNLRNLACKPREESTLRELIRELFVPFIHEYKVAYNVRDSCKSKESGNTGLLEGNLNKMEKTMNFFLVITPREPTEDIFESVHCLIFFI